MNRSAAIVRYGSKQWSLVQGDQLTAGRSTSCAVRLPDDEHLSRRAFALTVLDGYVLIHNTSTSKPLVLRPPVGEDHVVAPGSATTSLPYRTFGIVLAGSRGDVAVHVDAQALTPPPGDSVATRSTDTYTSSEFTAGQLRIMVELCRPLLTRRGAAARPATYAEIGERLDLSPQYVRNVIKGIRENLTGDGMPGLATEAGTTPNDDFRLSLARWALWSGWVSAADLGDDA
jgi:hypothetical protein